MRSGIQSSRSGAALIITLAFMVMLLGVLLAFFSQTTLQQQVSQSSSSLVSGDVMARGVVESIVGDLLQEIAAGSIATTNVTGGVTNILYFPATNANMVPSFSGFTPATAYTNAGLENLLKVSGTNPVFSVVTSAGATSNGPVRGSSSASTNLSYNGRSVSTARWNRSLLIGRQNPSDPADYTATNAFTNAIPQWILVARNGANPTRWSNNMIWSPTNATTVIGRYAYIIYNEGGTLDANVAGFPPTLTNSSVTNPAYVPYKAGTFFADLTQIGLTTNQINALVGWRNYVSASVSAGTFPSYNIPNNGTNYGATMMADTNGLLITYQTNSTSDRRFTSRQQLIEFLKAADPATTAVAGALNALQSLGIFSRSLDQPTYAPDSNRPKVVHPVGDNDDPGGTALTPVISSLLNNYCGGNDAWGLEDRINPAFLTNRVTGTFTRMDGSAAQVGEPLVKKRFPLSRLAWITHNGTPPSGVTTNQIKDAFGLTWDATNNRWTYDHGFSTNNSVYIGKLDQIRDLATKREPDFFELLKATLNAGSLGKAAAIGTPTLWTETIGAGEYYQIRDKSLDLQICQIGVNLIDQADSDSYPTALWINNPNRGGSGDGSKFFGVEDLPYFHRMFFKSLADKDDPPIPAVGGAPADYGTNPATLTGTQFRPGTSVLLGQPELWNPHDSTTWKSSTNRPTDFRISAVSEDPDGMIPIGSTNWTNYSIGIRFLAGGTGMYFYTNVSPSVTIAPGGGYYGQLVGGNVTPWCMTGLETNASDTYFGVALRTNTVTNNDGSVTTNYNYNTWSGAIGLGYYGYSSVWPDEGSQAMTNTATATSRVGGVILYGTELLVSCANSNLFREPTLLGIYDQPTGLSAGPGNRLTQARASVTNYKPQLTATSYPGYIVDAADNKKNVGFLMARKPTRYILVTQTNTATNGPFTYQVITQNYIAPQEPPFTVRLQYKDTNSGSWLTYDERFLDPSRDPYNNLSKYNTRDADTASTTMYNGAFFNYNNTSFPADVQAARYNSYDPRSTRFGHPMSPSYNGRYPNLVSGTTYPSPLLTTGTNPTMRPDNTLLYNAMAGIPGSCNTNTSNANYGTNIGWFNLLTANAYGANAFTQPGLRLGWLVENNPAAPQINSESPQYYADADDIVRRASGAFAATNGYGSNFEGIATAGSASQSRSVILNRPFRSVAEMSYAFRGSPWKNIDFSAPETGDAALLDVFCVKDAPTNALVAGKFDLNTRQKPVLKSLLSGAIKSALDGSMIPSTYLDAVAGAVVARTSGTNAWEGPLRNVSELAGKLLGKNVSGLPSDSSIYTSTIPAGRMFGSATNDYAGIWSYTSLGAVMANAISTNSPSDYPSGKIQQFREASLRAMADAGQCRVWNLMIDVIAQTGRYPQSATDLTKFKVDGEKRYWLHVAIDRLTGQILDKQMEAVTE